MVKYEQVKFKSGNLTLVGVIHLPKYLGNIGVVLCHPHPLYGGNMDNNVIYGLAEYLSNEGVVCLRFNFRGVDGSEGRYSGGEGEVIDTISAVNYLITKYKFKHVGLIGYSFGAYIASLAYKQISNKLSFYILISPPNNIMNFNHIREIKKPSLTILGDLDPFVNINELKSLGIKDIVVVNGADHFWWGFETKLAGIITNFLKENYM